jgi:hypothetical protein
VSVVGVPEVISAGLNVTLILSEGINTDVIETSAALKLGQTVLEKYSPTEGIDRTPWTVIHAPKTRSAIIPTTANG